MELPWHYACCIGSTVQSYPRARSRIPACLICPDAENRHSAQHHAGSLPFFRGPYYHRAPRPPGSCQNRPGQPSECRRRYASSRHLAGADQHRPPQGPTVCRQQRRSRRAGTNTRETKTRRVATATATTCDMAVPGAAARMDQMARTRTRHPWPDPDGQTHRGPSLSHRRRIPWTTKPNSPPPNSHRRLHSLRSPSPVALVTGTRTRPQFFSSTR